MKTTDAILKELGSDNIDLTPELLADAANDEVVVARLVSLCDRAGAKPRSITSHEANLVSWAPYIFAEVGCPTLVRPLAGLFSLRERMSAHLLGEYSGYDAPSIMLRLAGGDCARAFAKVTRTREAMPEFRISPLLASGAAWAHGLISREEGIAPLKAELLRLAHPDAPETEDQAWLDMTLDAALDIHPDGMLEELAEAAKVWELDKEWDDELNEARAEIMRDSMLRFREKYPRFDKAVEFVERWEQLDAELDSLEEEETEKLKEN